MDDPTMNVLVADPHPLTRRGISSTLTAHLSPVRIRESSTTAETVAALSQSAWDAVILEPFLPGRGGLDVLAEARRLTPRRPVLVFSLASDAQLAVRALRAGASGFLSKDARPDELAEAVRRVMSGGTYVTLATAERLAADLQQGTWPAHERLSDREFQVMHLIVQGQSIQEIAAELALSAKTISTFHARIWRKLGVTSDVALVRYATDHGLDIPAEPCRPRPLAFAAASGVAQRTARLAS